MSAAPMPSQRPQAIANDVSWKSSDMNVHSSAPDEQVHLGALHATGVRAEPQRPEAAGRAEFLAAHLR